MFKRFIVVALIAVSAVSFSGCFRQEEEPLPVGDTVQNVIRIGILSEAEDSSVGTHTLKTKSGEVVRLRSNLIDLSSPDYLGNAVQATGVLDENNVLNVTRISIVQGFVLSSGKLDAYENDDLGFRIQAPEGLKLEEFEDSLVLRGVDEENGEEYTIKFFQFPFPVDEPDFSDPEVGITKEEWDKSDEVDHFMSQYFPEVTTFEKIQIGSSGDITAAVVDGDGGDSSYYSYRSGLIYQVSYDVEPIPEDGEVVGTPSEKSGRDNLQEVLDSFEYTDSTAAIDSAGALTGTDPVGGVIDTDLPEESGGGTGSASNGSSSSSSSSSNNNTGSSGSAGDDDDDTTSADEGEDGGVLVGADGEFSAVPDEPVSAAGLNFIYLESPTFGFRVLYPDAWYYAGLTPLDEGVTRRYVFDTEEVDSPYGVMYLKVMNVPVYNLEDFDYKGETYQRGYSSDGGAVSLFTTVDDQLFQITGSVNYESVMLLMLSSIESI